MTALVVAFLEQSFNDTKRCETCSKDVCESELPFGKKSKTSSPQKSFPVPMCTTRKTIAFDKRYLNGKIKREGKKRDTLLSHSLFVFNNYQISIIHTVRILLVPIQYK